MDGEDLSSYDTVGDQESRNIDDQESLSKLEWELASESGRLTGKVCGCVCVCVCKLEGEGRTLSKRCQCPVA